MSKLSSSYSITGNSQTVFSEEQGQTTDRFYNSNTYHIVAGSHKKNYERKIRVLVKEIEQYVRENSPVTVGINRNISGMAMVSFEDNLVISADEGYLGIYNIDTMKISNSTSLNIPAINCILVTRTNFIFAAGISNEIYVLDYPSLEVKGVMLWNKKSNDGEVYSMCSSSNNSFLYTLGSDRRILRWDIEDLSTTIDSYVIFKDCGDSRIMRVKSDNTLLFLAKNSGIVEVYNLDTRDLVTKLFGHKENITAMQFSDDESFIATAAEDNTINIWKTEAYSCIKEFVGHTAEITDIRFTKDNLHLLSSSFDGSIRMWHLGKQFEPLIYTSGNPAVKLLLNSTNTLVYSGNANRSITAWKLYEDFEREEIFEWDREIIAIAHSKRGKMFAISDSMGNVILVPLSGKRGFKIIAQCEDPVKGLFMSEDGKWLAFTENKGSYFYIYNIDTGDTNQVYYHISSAIRQLEFDRECNILITASESHWIVVWDFATLVHKAILKGHSDDVRVVRIANFNQKLISGSRDAKIRIWDLTSNECEIELEFHIGEITQILITENESTVMSTDSSCTLFIWSLYTRAIQNKILMGDPKHNHEVFLNTDSYFMIVSHESIRFWDMETRIELTSVPCRKGSKLIMDNRWRYIYIAHNHKVIRLRNPLLQTGLSIYGKQNRHALLKSLYDIMVQREVPPNTMHNDDLLIMPYRINRLHLYVFYGLHNHLAAALSRKCGIIKTLTGFTPITISLHRRINEAATVLLESVNKELEHNKFIGHILEDSLTLLNKRGHELLPSVYSKLMITANYEVLPKFSSENISYPAMRLSEKMHCESSLFFTNAQQNLDGEMINFKESIIRLDYNMGSRGSLSFLNSILKCPNEDIYKSTMVKFLVLYKWHFARRLILFQTFLYLLYMIFLCMHILKSHETSSWELVVLIILNSFFFTWEGIQFAVAGRFYWKDGWNYIDITRMALLYSYVIAYYKEADSGDIKRLLQVLTIVSWIRGISYFRVTSMTRYFINLLTEVLKDIRAFLILLLYTTLAYAFINIIIQDRVGEAYFNDYLVISYNLDFGQLDMMDYGIVEWIVLTIVVIVNPIIMMNVLIAILGDTYSKVKSKSAIADLKELTAMIIETESLMFWRRKIQKKHYLHVCSKADEEKESEDALEMRMKHLEKLLISIRTDEQKFMEDFKGFKKAIDELSTHQEAVKESNYSYFESIMERLEKLEGCITKPSTPL
jgi:WD40 repeat protein